MSEMEASVRPGIGARPPFHSLPLRRTNYDPGALQESVPSQSGKTSHMGLLEV
ncbi:MTFR1L isoform 21 [Pongo abelii]|uniref:MTFR1L isoform 13 n=1 Tax=Pongo abelii TaxID=9601 RepID=A0A2J8SIP2_PONAB|nr:MTFR1L isoform 13 [Pongo abelii]PNJ20646.1 MTFR1L isoform 18 [Pongo abelii]PNJ20649.1 MTFR1L isoform 21 [Pongo abelii]